MPHEHLHADDPTSTTIDAALDELRELTLELQASRTRIVEAGDEARRRIERDLHDGAQQRFVSASLLLGSVMRAARRSDREDLFDHLAVVQREIDHGLAELRELARGIHPTVLSHLGLRPAVDTLASGGCVPVIVHGDLEKRPVASVEA